MKNINSLFGIVFVAMLVISCAEYETPAPDLENFTVYELDTDPSGNPIKGDEIGLSGIPAGETVRLEVTTSSDIAVFWPGDFSYRPWGTADSLLDSRNYEHYGQLGAEGVTTTATDGRTGWFRDYSWPEAGSYTTTVILTNHGTAGPDFEQRIFDFQVTVVN